MGVKYSGKIISSGKTIADYKDSPNAPQGVNLLAEYDATLGTFPTAQGWYVNGSQSINVITDEVDDTQTLLKRTVSDVSVYTSNAVLTDGWLVELDIRVINPGSGVYSHCIRFRASDNHAYEFSTDRIYVHTRDTSRKEIYYDDFQTRHRNIKLLHNDTSGLVELWVDDMLVNDSISETLSDTPGYRFAWGDSWMTNSAGRTAYWRTVKVYESWSK